MDLARTQENINVQNSNILVYLKWAIENEIFKIVCKIQKNI